MAGWTGKSDLDHIDTVATYLRSAIRSASSNGSSTGVYTNARENSIATTTTPTTATSVIPLEGYNVMEKLRGPNYRAGDPLYAIVATKPFLLQRGAVIGR